MCSAAESHARLPCLPSDLAQKIFHHLSMKDVCNASQASQSLWNITCQLSSLELFVNSADPIITTSFLSFLRRRSSKGLRIDRLSIHFPPTSVRTAELGQVLLSQLADIVATCSSTLHHLSLSIFKLAGRYVPVPSSSATEYNRLLAAICACNQLRSLVLRPLLDNARLPSESSLLQIFVAFLPELRVLLFQTATGLEEVLNIFKGEVIADLAAKNDPGLQLLLMDVSTIPENFALPKSLRYLFLSNEYNFHRGQPYQLLGSLCNLEELYLVGFPGRHSEAWQFNAALLQTYEKLRIAVVDYYGAPFGLVGTALLPSLELLALPGMIPSCATTTAETCAHTPVKLKCPKLKEVIFSCESEEDIPLLELLLSEGAPELETIQVAVDCERRADHSDPFLHLWRALARSSSLRNLKIIFRNYQVQDFDQQVQMALQGAALVEDMCLPRLETLELFSFTNDGGGPSFQLGSPLAHQQGAWGVCTEIGSLVAVGALPSLKQAHLYPGSDETGNALVGPGPRLDAAPHVKSFFLPQPDGWQDGNLTWTRPSHLDAELQCRVLAALTSIHMKQSWENCL
ncbi:g2791 [Coccomyxa elongata]